MKRLLWVLAWIAVALWSLFAWGAYGLLDFFGGVAARNADIVTGHPESVEWLSWALMTLRGLGLGAIVFVWGLVSLLILAVPAVLGLVFGDSGREQYREEWRGPRGDPRSPGPFPPASGQPPIRRIERR
jgi:hypothetical protein